MSLDRYYRRLPRNNCGKGKTCTVDISTHIVEKRPWELEAIQWEFFRSMITTNTLYWECPGLKGLKHSATGWAQLITSCGCAVNICFTHSVTSCDSMFYHAHVVKCIRTLYHFSLYTHVSYLNSVRAYNICSGDVKFSEEIIIIIDNVIVSGFRFILNVLANISLGCQTNLFTLTAKLVLHRTLRICFSFLRHNTLIQMSVFLWSTRPSWRSWSLLFTIYTMIQLLFKEPKS